MRSTQAVNHMETVFRFGSRTRAASPAGQSLADQALSSWGQAAALLRPAPSPGQSAAAALVPEQDCAVPEDRSAT